MKKAIHVIAGLVGNEGEWWMCKIKHSMRYQVLMKTKTGWCSSLNADGKPLMESTKTADDVEPLYQMTSEVLHGTGMSM